MVLLPETLQSRLRFGVPLAPLTTLRVGGPADVVFVARSEWELATAVRAAQLIGVTWFVIGGGSNLCVSDAGIRGLVIVNRAAELRLGTPVHVASGHSLMRLVVRTAAAGLGGLEFAVGIPGSVGGALVSNAGAYRKSIGSLVDSLVVAEDGDLRYVSPSWMSFGYRDSRLRQEGFPRASIISVDLHLRPRPSHDIVAEAREYQRNRIHRQPWGASAGSFFKNVYDADLAARVDGLPAELREAGVVPAGYLSAACGCRGLRHGGAEVSPRHGNFIVNRGNATASDIRCLAETVKRRVRETFGVTLEEEVLYVGEW